LALSAAGARWTFACFLTCLLPFVAASAGEAMGGSVSGIAQTAIVKSRIASFVMRISSRSPQNRFDTRAATAFPTNFEAVTYK
jgi:hypothetical protein